MPTRTPLLFQDGAALGSLSHREQSTVSELSNQYESQLEIWADFVSDDSASFELESNLFTHSHTFVHFSEIPVTRSTHFIGVPNTTLPMAKTLHNVLGCAVGLVSADETPEFRAAAAEVIRGVRFNILVQVSQANVVASAASWRVQLM